MSSDFSDLIRECLHSIRACRHYALRRDWGRLNRQRLQFDHLFSLLQNYLELHGDEELDVNQLTLLEGEIRRVQRLISRQMDLVKEDLFTVDRGINKLDQLKELVRQSEQK